MMDISKDELKEILRKHTLWVECEEGGERANLQRADLREANLWGADLRVANLWGANLQEANLQRADLQRANLREANLREADLQGANLREANLQRADLDYSCWPLWCGSLDVKVDVRLAAQLAYHFCRLVCDDPAYIQARNALVPLANTFHRADECGRLEILEAENA